jgi:proline iminopeptidase
MPHRQWAGEEKIILIGGSYGGFIALGYVLAHPSHISALILRNTWAYGFRGAIRIAATVASSPHIKSDKDALIRLWTGSVRDNEDFCATLNAITSLYTPEDKPQKKFEGASVCFRYETHNAAFSYSVPRFDVRSRLGEITVPTLVVVGRHDQVATVEDSEEIHGGIGGSELVVFEGSGHSPPSEEPEAFQERVWQFLNGLSS